MNSDIKYGLVGESLGHSFSPGIHRALAGYDYQLLPTSREGLRVLFEQRRFCGLNVTIPYKQSVMPLCDELDPAAAAIGAVNTVVNRGGRLIGYNTDIDGLLYMIRRAGIELSGRKVLILGSGGTSRTAQAAAQMLGAGSVTVISRTGETTYSDLHHHRDARIIINTTPVGMSPLSHRSPVDLSLFTSPEGVLDVVYNPLRTELFLQAEHMGIPCSCGLPMLVAQARRAAELFTGRSIPDAKMEKVLSSLAAQTENIILIGMPGSGKTTVGKALAAALGRPFIDLDEMIEERSGRSIPHIFETDGEEAFRSLETRCVNEVSGSTGAVISTGGGVVVREENYAPLHRSGVIIHLWREIDRLPTDGRPLSMQTAPNILWDRRRPLYEAFADITADNNGTPAQTLETIQKELEAR